MRRLNLFKNGNFVHICYRGSLGFSTIPKMSSVRPIVISGPSGAGKSTLLERLMKEFPNTFAFSVSHTTRNPRPGEQNGKHYHFVSRESFQKLVAENGFLEHTEFSGNCYGTSKQAVKEIQDTGRMCILDVDINGVKNIKKSHLDARYLFVRPPSIEELEKRLRSRGTETEESLKKRLDTANEAIVFSEQPGIYNHIIVNDDLDRAYSEFKGILSADIQALQSGCNCKCTC